MYILFYEQEVYERGTNMVKSLEIVGKLYGKAMLVLLYHDRVGDTSILLKEQKQKVKSLPFKEQIQKRPRWIMGLSHFPIYEVASLILSLLSIPILFTFCEIMVKIS